MAKSLRSSLLSTLLLAGLVFMGNEPVQGSDDLATATLEPVTAAITAGQQIELALTIRYDEDVDILFDPEGQDWGTMELLSTQTAPLHWVNGLWQYTIYMDTTFLLPDQHQIPALKVDVFKDSGHWQLQTQPQVIDVTSAFDELSFDVQSTIRLPRPEQGSPPMSKTHVLWAVFVLAGLSSVVLLRSRKAPPAVRVQKLSAAEIGQKAQTSGSADWEGLRLWLMVTTGSDPTGILTTREPLLHRYQSLRFSKEITTGDFVEYCNHCQERWG